MIETKYRSLLKSIVWRILSVINGFIVAFIFLNEFYQSLKISIIANITGFVLYYFHERFWNSIKWGKK
ncbi:DUF2061 domain-containing protein [Candidatus Pacearchaeota archaeon]|nr:DUF2061 domain-containing protein [Candidatus Pacearchaeota archaeon]